MAGISNLPFRLIARSLGCSLAYTEMISANGLVRKTAKTYEYLKTSADDRPLGVQIFGADPEIMAHAAGAHFLNPCIRSIIDIGGQDSKAILLDDKGKVKNFVMNDKCAAGTGRFLEVMARALEVNLDEFGAISQKSQSPSKISSLCTVFADSEVVSLISR